MQPFRLDKLAIFGVGLIGGSFALALRQAGAVGKVVGVGRSRANMESALALGVIDEAAGDARTAVAGADLVLVAVPVQQTQAVLADVARHLEPSTVVTDAGSTKQDVVEAARAALGDRLHQFVPAHPIAGAEHTGVAAARPALYQDKLVVVTPLAETAPHATELVENAWYASGARIRRMTPRRHDQVFAAVSHLPHAAAFALVQMIAGRPDAAELFSFAGSGFRDFTRIASSSPEMWRDISLANRDALVAELEAYLAALQTLTGQIRSGDAAAIERCFDAARTARDQWVQGVK